MTFPDVALLRARIENGPFDVVLDRPTALAILDAYEAAVRERDNVDADYRRDTETLRARWENARARAEVAEAELLDIKSRPFWMIR